MPTLKAYGALDMVHKVGDKWVLRVQREAIVGGVLVPVDMSASSYRCMWRVDPLDVAPVATATIDVSQATVGIVQATVSGSTSRSLGEGTWAWDFEDTTSESTLLTGLVTQQEDVSR